jgi:putative hydrolase of the HAD superfamily
MTIKAVFFDAAGTLIKPARRVGESYALMARKYGIDASTAEIADAFRAHFSKAPPLAFPNASHSEIDALERGWWKALVRNVFNATNGFDGFDEYFDELFTYFSQPESWTLYPEVVETLDGLKSRGISLDVISNFDSRLITILDGLGVRQWFDEVFISSRVGYAKPDRRIFEAALNSHRLSPDSALHVGDGLVNDFHGAIDAGLKGVLLDRGGEHDSIHSPRIASLKELLPLAGIQTAEY